MNKERKEGRRQGYREETHGQELPLKKKVAKKKAFLTPT
jgi:hypothetical protein